MSRAAYLATWRQKNPGKHKAHQKAKRAARKGVSHAKYLAEWRRNNRSKYTEHKKRQNAKMKAADRDANPKEVKKKKSKLETEYAEDTMAISTWMWSLASKQAEDLFYDTVTPRSGETKPAPPGAVFK